MKTLRLIAFALVAVLLFTAEDCENESDRKENAAVEKQQVALVQNQPVPYFDFSFERDMLTQLYQARNNKVSTYTVVQSPYTGKIMWGCASIGFPIPADTQLTNPLKTTVPNCSTCAVIEQAEPNGLYSSKTSHATWVLCLDAKGNITPVREERDITTFPYPVREENGVLVPIEGATSGLVLNRKK